MSEIAVMKKSLEDLTNAFQSGQPTGDDWQQAMALYQNPDLAFDLAKGGAFNKVEPAAAVTGGKAPKKDGVSDDEEGNTGPTQGASTKFDTNESAEQLAGGEAPTKDGITDSPEGNKGVVSKALVPEPGALIQQFQSDPGLAEVMDAVAPVQALVNHQEGIVKSLGSIADVLVRIEQRQAMLDTRLGAIEHVQKSLGSMQYQPQAQPAVVPAPTPQAAPVVAAVPVEVRNPLTESVAKSLHDLLTAVKQQAVVMNQQGQQLAAVTEAVQQQPASPHPAVAKSVQLQPDQPVLDRTMVIEAIRKSATADRPTVSPDQAARALRFVQANRDDSLLLPIVQQYAPGALPELGYARN